LTPKPPDRLEERPSQPHGTPLAQSSVAQADTLFEQEPIMWQKLFFGVMALLSISLTACNTVAGAGKDVQSAGREIQEEAQEHKPK
jgi:predicted small secreted protein